MAFPRGFREVLWTLQVQWRPGDDECVICGDRFDDFRSLRRHWSRHASLYANTPDELRTKLIQEAEEAEALEGTLSVEEKAVPQEEEDEVVIIPKPAIKYLIKSENADDLASPSSSDSSEDEWGSGRNGKKKKPAKKKRRRRKTFTPMPKRIKIELVVKEEENSLCAHAESLPPSESETVTRATCTPPPPPPPKSIPFPQYGDDVDEDAPLTKQKYAEGCSVL